MTQKIHLQQIDSSGASSGQVISWDATNNAWVPSTPTGGGGSSNTSMSASDILTSIKTVDGASSGLDADLLDGQEGSYYLNAGNLTGTVPAARLPAFTGDVTKASGGSSLTLATVNSNVGSFGSATAIPVVTVNDKGLVTAVSTVAPNMNNLALTGVPTAPTAAENTNTTQLATTAYVQTNLSSYSKIKGFSVFWPGTVTANANIGGSIAPYSYTISQAACKARSLVAAAAQSIFTIKKNGASIGTVTFAASSTTGTVSITSTAVVVGDLLTISAPGTADANLADITMIVVSS